MILLEGLKEAGELTKGLSFDLIVIVWRKNPHKIPSAGLVANLNFNLKNLGQPLTESSNGPQISVEIQCI